MEKIYWYRAKWMSRHFLEISEFSFQGIKKYIVGLIIKTSSDSDSGEKEKVYLMKLNIILVQVYRILVDSWKCNIWCISLSQ